MTLTDQDWQPFGITDEDYPEPDSRGTRVINIAGRRWGRKGRQDDGPKDRAGTWLRNAMIALALLAGIAAVVSYSAQYWLVYSFKHSTAIAALQAGIPDTGALVFAALGISLALQGRRAIRPRALNVLCVGISIAMNALAASAGWRALAVWTMAPLLYALASDTLIGVIRAYAIARQRQLREDLADDETTPLAILGGVFLWALRLTLAAPSTLAGFRGWVVDTCPVAPGRSVAGQRAREALAAAEQLAITAGAAEDAARTAQSEAEDAREELAKSRADTERAVSEAQSSAQAETSAAAAAREQASADAASTVAAAEARAREAEHLAALAAAERDRLREEAARLHGQTQAALRERDQARAEAATTAQSAAAARQAAQMAQGELSRTRDDAERQVAQIREDAERGRAELRSAFQASAAAAVAPARRRAEQAAPRPESKHARLIAAYEALNGTDARYGDRSKASEVARELAPEVELEWGSARTYLYRHIDSKAGA